MENMGPWPVSMPGMYPVAALPLVNPVQGSLKGNCLSCDLFHVDGSFSLALKYLEIP